MCVVGLAAMYKLADLVDLTEEEVLHLLKSWRDYVIRWDTDDELAYVLIKSLVSKHFQRLMDDANGEST